MMVVDAYDAGFVLALEQVKIIAPGLDVSKLSPQLEVRDGKLVPCEPFVNQRNAPTWCNFNYA